MSETYDLLIIGGGAAGFFAAAHAGRRKPGLRIAILEKNRDVLQKVKVSGGGRCNVTHSCFDTDRLLENYPRGYTFLKPPFNRFGPAQTVEWFAQGGVKLKTEKDGRMFPVTDSSQTIMDCLIQESKKAGAEIYTHTRVDKFEFVDKLWRVETQQNGIFFARNLLIATGSDKRIWDQLNELTLRIIPPVPSLFTFNLPDHPIRELQGISFNRVNVSLAHSDLNTDGPILITHWGLSGPAVLKLSAKAALLLHEREYRFKVTVNWLPDISRAEVETSLKELTVTFSKKNVSSQIPFGLTGRFWKFICEQAGIRAFQKFAETGNRHIKTLSGLLCEMTFDVNGKSTFKEEFVTAGGIDLSEVDDRSFGSVRWPGLYLAGEVLNIDAVTGGFNFQAAWTGAWHVAESVCSQAFPPGRKTISRKDGVSGR